MPRCGRRIRNKGCWRKEAKVAEQRPEGFVPVLGTGNLTWVERHPTAEFSDYNIVRTRAHGSGTQSQCGNRDKRNSTRINTNGELMMMTMRGRGFVVGADVGVVDGAAVGASVDAGQAMNRSNLRLTNAHSGDESAAWSFGW